MYFYLFKKDGILLGFLQSEATVELPNIVQVSEAEFENAGGVVSEEKHEDSISLLELKEKVEELEEAFDVMVEGIV